MEEKIILERTEDLLKIADRDTRTKEVDSLFEEIKDQSNEIKNAAIDTFLDYIWETDLESSEDTILLGEPASVTRERLDSIMNYVKEKDYVDSRILKTRLDPNMLKRISLIENPSAFERKSVRINTSMQYRQQKYNLLHEESEGFAKLIEELAAAVGPQYQDEDEIALNKRAQILLEHISAYIGYFRLDPNRVLDLILDALIENVKTDYKIFITLLKISPWGEINSDNGDVLMLDARREIDGIDEDIKPSILGNPFIGQLFGHRYQRHFSDNVAFAEKNIELLNLACAITIHQRLTCILDVLPYLKGHTDEIIIGLLEIGDFQDAKYPIYCKDNMKLSNEIRDRLRTIFEIAVRPAYISECDTGIKKPELKIPHFYHEKNEIITKFNKVEEVTQKGYELILLIGTAFARDIPSLTRLIRVGRAQLKKLNDEKYLEPEDLKKNTSELKQKINEAKQKIKNKWYKICAMVILPGITLTALIAEIPSLVGEAWDLLKLINFEERFALYAEWKRICENPDDELKPAIRKTQEVINYVTRRITEDNYRDFSRQIGRSSHPNPIVMFNTLLRWVRNHSSLVMPLVESCKYLSSLSFDVIIYLVLESLASNNDKVKEDGQNYASWLVNLATFCGNICRKYGNFSIESILKYIYLKLKRLEAYDLIVLSQLIDAMGGITSTVGAVGVLSPMDISIKGTGDNIRKEKLYGFTDKSIRKSSRRLAEALTRTGLAIPIAIELGRLKRHFAEKGDKDFHHIKLIINGVDRSQGLFLQYCEFLSLHLSLTTYSNRVPSIKDLRIDNRLEPDAAFRICRRKLSDLVANPPNEATATNSQEGSTDNNQSENSSMWQKGLMETYEQVKKTLPAPVWEKISPEFYTTFWQMSLYDIIYPKEVYSSYLTQLKKQISENHRSKREKERFTSIQKKVDEDRIEHEAHYARAKERLNIEKDHWFSNLLAERKEIVNAIWQHCLYPRLSSSADDALYCAKFIERMHELGTANFSTLTLYDQIFTESVQIILFTMTEQEARHYGRFLNTILEFLSKLHGDEEAFKQYGQGEHGLPGFIMKWPTQNRQAFVVSKTDLINYQEFREVFHKWHCKLRTAFINALGSSQFIEYRNALIALSCISDYFPALIQHGDALKKKVDEIANKSELDEIKVLAKSYVGILQKREKLWVLKEKFYTPKQGRKGGSIPTTNSTTAESSKTDKQTPSSQSVAQPANTSIAESSQSPQPEKKPISRVSSPKPQISLTSASTNQPVSASSPSSNLAPKSGTMVHPLPKKPKPEQIKPEKSETLRVEERSDSRRERPERERSRDRTTRIRAPEESPDKRNPAPNEEKRASEHHRRDKERVNEKIREEKPRETQRLDERREIPRDERRSNDRRTQESTSTRRHEETGGNTRRPEPSPPRRRPREDDITTRRPKTPVEEMDSSNRISRHVSSTSTKRERDRDGDSPNSKKTKTVVSSSSSHQPISSPRSPIKLNRSSSSSTKSHNNFEGTSGQIKSSLSSSSRHPTTEGSSSKRDPRRLGRNAVANNNNALFLEENLSNISLTDGGDRETTSTTVNNIKQNSDNSNIDADSGEIEDTNEYEVKEKSNLSEDTSVIAISSKKEHDNNEETTPQLRQRPGRTRPSDMGKRITSWFSSFWVPPHDPAESADTIPDEGDPEYAHFKRGHLDSIENNSTIGAADSSSRAATIDASIWLMGVRYEVTERASSESSRSFYDPTTYYFSPPGSFPHLPGQQQQLSFASYPSEFYDDFTSRIWCTYRHNYAPIRPTNFTSDAGWGCMLRTGQSLLANALIIQFLGREWRRVRKGEDTWGTYTQILTWFLDDMSSICPFSVHRVALLGKQLGKNIGEWFGPSTASQAIKALVDNFPTAQLSVHVSTDGVVYKNEVYKAARNNQNHQEFQSVLILVAIKLGPNKLNPIYYDALKAFFRFPESVGIAGGKPSSSYYFIGSQGDDLFYLDPHHSRPVVDLKDIDEFTDEELATFHCDTLRKIHISQLDPSMLLGFYCRDAQAFEEFCARVEEIARTHKPSVLTIADEEPVYDDSNPGALFGVLSEDEEETNIKRSISQCNT
ncbi:9226_t:CDS:10 [Ambispora leptoticha]|uniref:THO complex subunit 2 n=1 Tax=Ambispora leptoticha TaxID=144679 RepID=A0A9N8ZZF2_9GLOM|nr:9226_t:CDS:10 [Ambispora leptoticha]